MNGSLKHHILILLSTYHMPLQCQSRMLLEVSLFRFFDQFLLMIAQFEYGAEWPHEIYRTVIPYRRNEDEWAHISATTKDTLAYLWSLKIVNEIIRKHYDGNVALESTAWISCCLLSCCFCDSFFVPSVVWLPNILIDSRTLLSLPTRLPGNSNFVVFSQYFYVLPINEIKFLSRINVSLNRTEVVLIFDRERGNRFFFETAVVTEWRRWAKCCYTKIISIDLLWKPQFLWKQICQIPRFDLSRRWKGMVYFFFVIYSSFSYRIIECLNKSDLWSVAKVSISIMMIRFFCWFFLPSPAKRVYY